MRECQGCGTMVSERYVRVWGRNDGELHGCCHCQTKMSPKHRDDLPVQMIEVSDDAR